MLFKSRKRGLRPLLECVTEWGGKIQGACLADRVTGMAAARLIAVSGMVNRVEAGVISKEALHYLETNAIATAGARTTDVIRKADGGGICPMEELSRRLPRDGDFLPALFNYFSLNVPTFLL